MKKILSYSFLIVCTLLFGSQGVYANFSVNDSYVYLNNLDAPATIDDIQSELTVFDDFDGDITDSIYVVLDNYTGNENIAGDFIVVFGVNDSGGNESTIAIIVRNVDVTAPMIIIESYRSLAIPQYSNIYLNSPLIKAIDSYEGDLSSSLIISGLSEVDTSILGDYILTYSITDSSGNTHSEDIIVSVVDVTKPILVGVEEIHKNRSYIMSTTDIIRYFSASDDTDGNITSSIVIDVNQYVGNADKVGSYLMILSVTDSYGNKTTQELIITVIDSIIPLLIVDKYTWVVADSYKLTGSDFISTLKSIGDLPNDTYVQEITLDTYSDNYNDLSDSEFRFLLLSSSGNEYSRNISLNVITGTISAKSERTYITVISISQVKCCVTSKNGSFT